MPALVLALGFEMTITVGTSLLVISVNSGAALAARLGAGIHLDWPLTGMFTLAALAVLLIAVAACTLSRSLPA